MPDMTYEPAELEYIDRDGKPMTMKEWSLQFEDEQYRRVDETWLNEKFYTYQVSTVWLGIVGQIFETMVFARGPSDPAGMDMYQIRCDNLIEAERQHGSTVVALNKKLGLTQ